MAKRSRAKSIVGTLVMLACLAYFADYAVSNLEAPPDLDWASPTIWIVFTTTIGLYACSLAVLGFAWIVLLRSLGAPIPLAPAIWVVCASQIGKYLPGNVFHFVGRVALAKEFGCNAVVTSASLVLEIIWFTGVGILVTLAWMGFSGTPSGLGLGDKNQLALLLLVPVAFMMWPPLLHKGARLIGSRVTRLAPLAEAPLPGIRCLVTCFFLYVVNYSLMGLNLYLLAGLFTAGPPSLSLAGFIGMGCIAWLIGYVTPGSPGGLGVREALLVSFLAPYLGPVAAIETTLAFRIVTVVADALTFLVASPLLARAVKPFNINVTL